MAQELDCIIRTGSFTFHFGREALGSGKDGVFLVYEPSSSTHLPAPTHSPQQEMGEPHQELQTDLEKVRKERWNYEQIADFVRKLGFMDKQKGDQNIKHFLYLSQVSYIAITCTYLSQLLNTSIDIHGCIEEHMILKVLLHIQKCGYHNHTAMEKY